MECPEFFSALDELEDGGKRGENLRKVPSQKLLDWQRERASPHSPGPVADDELLRLALYEGRQVVDGVLHRNAFRPLETIGLSTDREKHADERESMWRADAKGQRDGIPLWGFVSLETSHLRRLKVPKSEVQAVGVYDTAVAPAENRLGNPAHAEGFLISKDSNTVPIKSVLTDLMDRYRDKIRQRSMR